MAWYISKELHTTFPHELYAPRIFHIVWVGMAELFHAGLGFHIQYHIT